MATNDAALEGYYTGKELATLRSMGQGKRMVNPFALKSFLRELNKSTPFYNVDPNLGALQRAWKHDMSGMIVEGSIAPWLRTQLQQPDGMRHVVNRLHQTMVDIYSDPSRNDPTGMVRTGVLLQALQDKVPVEKQDDVQAMFVAMYRDLKKSDAALAQQLLTAALADYALRSGVKPQAMREEGHGLPQAWRAQNVQQRLST